ncbi:MAG: TlpA disulfide reductase family protein [Gammaproteobacteria bacterium]
MMKKLIIILPLIFLLNSCENAPTITKVDDSRGQALVDTQGNPWRFSDHKGKWIIVNYWASWCKPCITEVPELEAFHQAHKEKDAIVLGVNYDFVSAAETAQLAKKYGMSYPVLISEQDPRIQLGSDPVMVLPTTFVINPEGQVIAALVGEQSQASLEDIINE